MRMITRKIDFYFVALIVFVISATAVFAWEPSYTHKKDSSFLKQMDLILRTKWSKPDGLIICEVLLDPKSKILPDDSQISLLLNRPQVLYGTVLQADHSLGEFTSYTEDGFDKGKFVKRYGFRFYIKPDLVNNAYLNFSFTGKDQNGKDQTGTHILNLKDFVSDAYLQKKIESGRRGILTPAPHTTGHTDP